MPLWPSSTLPNHPPPIWMVTSELASPGPEGVLLATPRDGRDVWPMPDGSPTWRDSSQDEACLGLVRGPGEGAQVSVSPRDLPDSECGFELDAQRHL